MSRTLLAAALLAFMLGGCVGPLVPVIDVDAQSAEKVRKEIRIFESGEISTDQYRYLGPVSATSCMNKLWDRPASRDDAVSQILYKAKLAGGNGVSGLLCERAAGTSLATN